MPTRRRDSQGFYRALRLDPRATEEQIQLAYEMLCEMPGHQGGSARSRIERAYTTLINPASRAAYDRLERQPPPKPRRRIGLGDGRILAACVGLLAAILVLVWLPLYGSRLRSFETGDKVNDLDGRPFGRIVQTDEDHLFPRNVRSSAYLVEMAGTGELRWYPAADLQAVCRRSH